MGTLRVVVGESEVFKGTRNMHSSIAAVHGYFDTAVNGYKVGGQQSKVRVCVEITEEFLGLTSWLRRTAAVSLVARLTG